MSSKTVPSPVNLIDMLVIGDVFRGSSRVSYLGVTLYGPLVVGEVKVGI